MSRKRKLKKQRKRRAQWTLHLEDLYLRQADEAFLEAAGPRFQELEAASLADVYDEVTDRALAGALTGGDPERVRQLLARIRRGPDPRPLVLLAEAVDLLARGHRERAAARLASFGEAGPGSEAALGAARHLLPRLRALADPQGVPAAEQSTDGSAPWRELEETARLTRAVEAHAVSGGGLPRSLEPEDSAARAVWDFYRALAAVAARNFRPGAKTLSALARAVATLKSQGPVDRLLGHLLRETQRRQRALAGLHQLEQTLRRRRGRGAQHEEILLERLGTAGLDPKLIQDQPLALLQPLQQALRQRWRGLLELVLERRGAAGLAVLFAARPELLAVDLDAGTGVAAARRWAQAKALLGSRSFGELAAFLRTAGARAKTSGRLAALWSLELWARRSETEGVDLDQAHLALVRLIEMAVAIDHRFTAAERPQVARFLRDELLELCNVLYVCGHFLDAAKALLEHLGDDSGLLAVALAGAVSSRDDRTRRAVTARIAALGPARADQETLLRLIDNLAAERPSITVPVLTALKPLFTGAGWSEALDRVAPEAVDGMRRGLVEAYDVEAEDPEGAAWVLSEVRKDLELYRPLLDGRPELAALELAVDCYGTPPAAAKLAVGSFLDRFEGLEPALVLYGQALDLSAVGVSPQVDAALTEAVIDRLDARWTLWLRFLIPLAFDATARQFRRLRKKIRRLLKDADLEDDDRQALRDILEQAGEIRKARRLASILPPDLELPGLEAAEEPEGKPRKPRARRPRPVDDRQLDLFAPE